MMRLPRFRYSAPRTVDDAVKMLADFGPDAQVVAGGTDLWPNMKRRQLTPARVIGLRQIAALARRETRPDGGLTLGAMTSLAALERDDAVGRAWPVLAAAARTISTPPLRNMGTLGGNLCIDTRCNYWTQSWEWRKSIDFCLKKDGDTCWVAPGSDRCWAVASSDTAPVLCAIGAEVELASVEGVRRIAAPELFADDGIAFLAKRADELVTAVHLPAPAAGARASWRKLRRRGSFDFAVLGVAAYARVGERGTVEEARVVLSGVGSRPKEARDAAAALVGQKLDERAIAACADAAARVAKPLDNTDFELGWRKEMARALVTDALTDLARA